MNILYVVNIFSVIEPYGTLQLSAITKANGHQSFIATIEEGGIAQKIVDHKINAVAFSSFMSTEAGPFLELAIQLRKQFPDLVIIAGGPHPTYYPQIIDHWPIDAVVIGEGDLVINELLENLVAGKDIRHIPNVHTKTFKNPQGNLVEDLDTLPFADRELIRDKEPYRYIRLKSFFATRGCPFKCSYCFNSAYNEMYKGKGTIRRRRSVESLITEIEQVKNAFPTDFVRFGDDVFIVRRDEWVEEFAEKYKARIGLPFYFLMHPNLAEEKLIRMLKDAGCHSVMMGIESGVEHLRKKILDRHVNDETMLKAFKYFRDNNIQVFSNTILGLPDSTIEDDIKSAEFTLKCHPRYSGFTVFTPFPGTNLYKYSKDHGYLRNDDPFAFVDGVPKSMQQDSILNHISEKRKWVHRNILVLAPIANWLPWLRPLIMKHLIFWKPNKFFDTCGFFVRNYLNMTIWPFSKSLYTFVLLFKKVTRIDKKNYEARPKDPEPQAEKVEVAQAL